MVCEAFQMNPLGPIQGDGDVHYDHIWKTWALLRPELADLFE
jgi:hypothetical protein